jgi:hypothetical protein
MQMNLHGTDFAEIISFNFHLAIPNPAHQSQKIALLELFALFKEMISAKSVPTRNGLDVGRDRNTGITRAIYKGCCPKARKLLCWNFSLCSLRTLSSSCPAVRASSSASRPDSRATARQRAQ